MERRLVLLARMKHRAAFFIVVTFIGFIALVVLFFGVVGDITHHSASSRPTWRSSRRSAKGRRSVELSMSHKETATGTQRYRQMSIGVCAWSQSSFQR